MMPPDRMNSGASSEMTSSTTTSTTIPAPSANDVVPTSVPRLSSIPTTTTSNNNTIPIPTNNHTILPPPGTALPFVLPKKPSTTTNRRNVTFSDRGSFHRMYSNDYPQYNPQHTKYCSRIDDTILLQQLLTGGGGVMSTLATTDHVADVKTTAATTNDNLYTGTNNITLNTNDDDNNNPPHEDVPDESPTSNGIVSSIVPPVRLVVVRYFLDRPGFTEDNSAAARFWFNVPSICRPNDVNAFLIQQGILHPPKLSNDNTTSNDPKADNDPLSSSSLIVELYMDRFHSYMLLEICQSVGVTWDFSDTSTYEPGVLNVRLTATLPLLDEWGTGVCTKQQEVVQQHGHMKHHHHQHTPKSTPPSSRSGSGEHHANTTPIGLFSYSMMTGLEAASLLITLTSNTVKLGFYLMWGPYMFFVGGFLMIVTGIMQVLRNNIFGGVAFAVFGSVWFSNGTRLILITFFTADNGSLAYTLYHDANDSDDWGRFVILCYVIGCVLVLIKQTFVMSKLTTIHLVLAAIKLSFQLFVPWSPIVMGWMQFVAGVLTSLFSFYLFVVDLTNQVYHREVYKSYKWNEQESPDEVFGTAGVGTSLFSKATLLRQAQELQQQQLRSMTSTTTASSSDQSGTTTSSNSVQPHEPTVVTLRCVGTKNADCTVVKPTTTKENYPADAPNTTSSTHTTITPLSNNSFVTANHTKSKMP